MNYSEAEHGGIFFIYYMEKIMIQSLFYFIVNLSNLRKLRI